MMNALFGVLGAPACRFFDPAVANAITGFGQQTLRWTREAFAAAGVRVLYGDTDSVFVQLAAAATPGEAESACAPRVEAEIGARVEREYGVRLAPRARARAASSTASSCRACAAGAAAARSATPAGSPTAAASSWWSGSSRCAATGRRSRGACSRACSSALFQDREVLPFVREIVARVRAGELDAELVYAKRIRKGALERYTAPSRRTCRPRARRAAARAA